jgi:hypothetical protein
MAVGIETTPAFLGGLGELEDHSERGPRLHHISMKALCNSQERRKHQARHSAQGPCLASVTSRGQDAYGRVFRVRCSPERGAGSDGFSYLKVTIQSNGEAVTTPEH